MIKLKDKFTLEVKESLNLFCGVSMVVQKSIETEISQHYKCSGAKSFNKASLIYQIEHYGGMVDLYQTSQYMQCKRMTNFIIPRRW